MYIQKRPLSPHAKRRRTLVVAGGISAGLCLTALVIAAVASALWFIADLLRYVIHG